MSKKETDEEQREKADIRAESLLLKKKKTATMSDQKDDDTPPLWLVSFADVMALMLTFFVLTYSMSSPELGKWNEMTSALNDGFDQFKNQVFEAGSQETIEIEKIDMTRALNLEYLQSIIGKLSDENEALADLALFLQKDRLVISLPQNLLFQPGQARVSVDGKRAMYTLGAILSRIRNQIEIVGHTDPTPITNQSGQFRDNYELSLARAISVASVLKGNGYKKNITTRGMSSARYEELSGAVDDATRLSLARRVDIVVRKDDGSVRSFMNLGSE